MKCCYCLLQVLLGLPSRKQAKSVHPTLSRALPPYKNGRSLPGKLPLIPSPTTTTLPSGSQPWPPLSLPLAVTAPCSTCSCGMSKWQVCLHLWWAVAETLQSINKANVLLSPYLLFQLEGFQYINKLCFICKEQGFWVQCPPLAWLSMTVPKVAYAKGNWTATASLVCVQRLSKTGMPEWAGYGGPRAQAQLCVWTLPSKAQPMREACGMGQEWTWKLLPYACVPWIHLEEVISV
jgi:hypothetical protein